MVRSSNVSSKQPNFPCSPHSSRAGRRLTKARPLEVINGPARRRRAAAASARSRPVKPETPSPGPAGALSLSRTQIDSDTESDRRDPTQWQALATNLNLNLPVTRSRARVTSLSYEYLESDSDSKHFRLFGRMRSLNLKLQVKFHRVLVTVTGRTRVAGPPSSGCGPAPHRTGIAANPGLYLNFVVQVTGNPSHRW